MTKKLTWDPKVANVYRKMLPPGPPSKSELKIYERYIKEVKRKRDPKILILGSTAGTRDLCSKYKLAYTSVDYHEVNFRIMGTVLKYKDTGRLIVADWQKMNLNEKFDLILGDIAFHMMPFKDLDKVLVRLKKILKKDGVIVHRSWMRKKGHFKDLAKFLKNEYPKLRKKKIPSFTILVLPFLMYYYDEKKDQVLFAQNLKDFKKFVDRGLLPKKDYDNFDYFLNAYFLPMTYPLKPRFEAKLKKYFKINKILKGADWYRDYALMYILDQK